MRVILPVTAVALALTSSVHGVAPKAANVTADAQIHIYPFVTPDCTGQPFTSPYEMKHGECVNMNQAHSLRPRFRFDHANWIEKVNKLQMHCKLETFSDFGCPDGKNVKEYQQGLDGDMPKHINSCLTPQQLQAGGSPIGFFSARFVCNKPKEPEHVCTKIITHTTWSIDPTYGAPHYEENTATYTGTLSMSTQKGAAIDKRFEPGRETKGVWMHHPWSRSLLCYLCYPKKEHDYRKVECRAGVGFPANCGLAPALAPNGEPASTTTTTTTTVTTIHSTKAAVERANPPVAEHLDLSDTDSDTDSNLPDLDFGLQQKKSWHTPVKFQHPFVQGKEACADAEWEKRGQIGRDYIKIQKVHICGDKDRDDSQWIGFPAIAVHTVNVPKGAASKVRHDQL